MRHAGIQMVDDGAYDDGLKAFQLASMGTTDPELKACLYVESAQPLAAMGRKDLALDALETSGTLLAKRAIADVLLCSRSGPGRDWSR
jgi:hypothetical protein